MIQNYIRTDDDLFNEVVKALDSGESRVSIAKRMGITYGKVYSISQAICYVSPNDYRNKKTWREKISSYIDQAPGGCIKWLGPTNGGVYLSSTMPTISSKRCMLLFLQILQPTDHTKTLPWGPMSCGNKWCHNPHHSATYGMSPKTKEARNKMIADLWKLNLEHKTTMQQLGKKFGLSKQRVEQIIREAGL